jgi:DNA helicase-2/ATP-dependent DNA helicase PcrA
MYTPKLRDRSTVKLNERQEGAATWSGKVRPTCISGPAGSGKSLVLTERLANLVKKPPREMGMSPYDPDFRILFTTFNKELSAELKNWIGDVLGDKAEWTGGGFTFVGSQFQNIRLLHFDVIPTRIGRYSHIGSRLLGGSAAVSINAVIERVRKELELRLGEHADILDPDYIEEEFDRVFYGMELTSLREYQTVARKGRGQKGGGPEQRRIVGKVMEEWMRHCHKESTYTFHMIRRMFLNDLKKERHRPMFTDIFVDEFQDCTPADFSIFYRLLKDSNRLVVAGDLAQSVHLGTTADMPRDRLDQGEDQRNFRRIFLEGSYRLPLHISLCVQGLSKAIQSRQKESGMMSPYEGAPPGVRLLFVSAIGADEMASKLSAIMETYAPYRRRLQGEGADERAVIMESDKELAKALSKLRPNSVMSDTILRLKGLEKSMVIWSTRALYQSEDDSLEFVYTILTRSSGLAVIAYFEGETPDSYRTVMNTLNKELLLSWDKRSQDALDALQTDKLEDNELVF